VFWFFTYNEPESWKMYAEQMKIYNAYVLPIPCTIYKKHTEKLCKTSSIISLNLWEVAFWFFTYNEPELQKMYTEQMKTINTQIMQIHIHY
jgi:hypothetical protein